MKTTHLQALRSALKPHLTDYLKRSAIPFYPPEVFDCPACRKTAGLLPGNLWLCRSCGRRGDTVDLAMATGIYATEADAIKAVCRLLHIKITELEAISSEELLAQTFPSAPYLVDRLLGKGVYLLAGASKIGKSWLVLWMANQISLGEPVWELNTTQGQVLYISLEDSLQRLQQRLNRIAGPEVGPIWFATEAELLGSGFEEQAAHFLQAHPEVTLMIIDTLQRIRPSRSEQYSYSGDYEAISTLKAIADRFHITILLVHHTRKEGSEDAFDMISGTTGLMGCADGALVLQKSSRLGSTATLTATGREIPDLQLKLLFDREQMKWTFLGYGTEQPAAPEDPILSTLSDLVSELREWHGTSTDLLALLQTRNELIEARPNTMVRKLNASSALLAQEYRIRYRTSRSQNTKLIHLALLNDDRCDWSDISPSASTPDNIVPIERAPHWTLPH